MNYDDLLLLPENFYWAWRKAKRLYESADILYHQAELAEFELNLEQNLNEIRRDFESGEYRTHEIKLLPQPKKPKSGKPRMRQSVNISVRDQVAWIALVNVIGPRLDMEMPEWSYGHRLYRTTWYDDSPDEKSSVLNIGPYRHSTAKLYRPFNQSWPLYRRQIAFTARRMVGSDISDAEMSTGDKHAYARGKQELEYLVDGYWSNSRRKGADLHFASLDLLTFYPTIRRSHIMRSIAENLIGYSPKSLIARTLENLLRFRTSAEGLSSAVLDATEPAIENPADYDRIPTGLWTAGFLSNVAMLSVDKLVSEIVRDRRNFAQFRFVDDHSILAYDFDQLVQWIKEYRTLLSTILDGVSVAEDKYCPSDLNAVIEGREITEEMRSAVISDTLINGAHPTKLMTHTLAQVSIVANTDFDVIGEQARSQRLEQLEWLLQVT